VPRCYNAVKHTYRVLSVVSQSLNTGAVELFWFGSRIELSEKNTQSSGMFGSDQDTTSKLFQRAAFGSGFKITK
jgi:hypothetical protein